VQFNIVNKELNDMKMNFFLKTLILTILCLFSLEGYAAMSASEQFLDTNKTKKGVVTLPSGLQYEVLEAGKGSKPNKTDMVTVDYEGKLVDGTVFDSSYKRGEPATFPVNGVIQGWQEALPLMNEGSTWMLYIPSDLAYGEQGAGGAIGPNQALIFKVHLIKVK
jgi:FKBP-type peptidyl-prolyl cis-trans isomerase FklB